VIQIGLMFGTQRSISTEAKRNSFSILRVSLSKKRMEGAILNSRLKTTPDVLEVFRILFSSTKTPDEYLTQFLANKNPEEVIVLDILKLAENARRDLGYDMIDGYLVWYVAYNDASYKEYLNISFIPLEPMYPGKPFNQGDPPVIRGIINSYLRWAFPLDPIKRNQASKFLYEMLKDQKTLLSVYNRLREYVGSS
jgi:hypothetical protein